MTASNDSEDDGRFCSPGGEEFQTGRSISVDSTTSDCQRLHRNFPKFFRRQGAESDLILRVVDTPPMFPLPCDVARLCPEGVHVLVLVLRVDLVHTGSHLEDFVQVRALTKVTIINVHFACKCVYFVCLDSPRPGLASSRSTCPHAR